MRAQGARASPGSPRIQTVIRADPRKADATRGYDPVNTGCASKVLHSGCSSYFILFVLFIFPLIPLTYANRYRHL
jgi:hypothetical protein